MKNINKLITCFILAAVIFAACRPEKFEEVGEPRDIPSSFAGTWKLTKATQKDEDAAKKGFPYTTLDLAAIFPYTDYQLKLDVNSNGTLGNFTATPGNSPAIINLTSGTWSVDDGKAPTSIIFKQGSNTQAVTLGAYPIVSSNQKLTFRIEKKDGTGKVMISYTYEFTKQ